MIELRGRWFAADQILMIEPLGDCLRIRFSGWVEDVEYLDEVEKKMFLMKVREWKERRSR